ncbi:MAG: tetratricopeptide repeat protein [Candidatus Acidiferrum sp.]
MQVRQVLMHGQKKFATVVDCPRQFPLSIGRARLLSCAALAIWVATLIGTTSAAPFEKSGFAQHSGSAAIQGTVRDSAGTPVGDATLLLEEKGNSEIVQTKTNPDGGYLLTISHAGRYTVRAKKSGYVDTVVDAIAMSLGEKKQIDLVLTSRESLKSETAAASASAKAAAGEMEFKDEPNFTVAGVTDWSNLGLHGSAASSRTSESLAKETLGLKSSGPQPSTSASSSKEYETALAYREKGDIASARGEVRKTLAVANNPEGHRLLGELDEQLGDPLGSVQEYETAVRMDPSEQNYFEWGTELLLHKAGEPAVEVFARGHSAHPDSARMLTGLGAALFASGSAEEAARRLCEAADLQPSDPTPYLFLGKIERTTPGLLPCSEQKLARFAQEQPGNALANYYYAISLWKREKGSDNPAEVKKVESLLEKAVTIDPKCDEAYLQLGVVHSMHGDLEVAIGDYEKAIEVNPNLGEAHRQLGLAYQRRGEKAKAQQEFEDYEQAEKMETAETERQQKERQQFLIILKKQPTTAPQ